MIGHQIRIWPNFKEKKYKTSAWVVFQEEENNKHNPQKSVSLPKSFSQQIKNALD